MLRHIEHFTHRCAKWAGTTGGFGAAICSILLWVLAGYFFDFSKNWQEGLSIYIEIITFLMIFVIQRSQNKELAALHVKLNELIAVTHRADNRLINAEGMTEQEISDVQETHRQIGDGQ